MKKFTKSISLMLVLVVLSVALVGCGNGDDTSSDSSSGNTGEVEHSFDIAMDSPEDTVTYLFADKFASLLEEKSDGKIEVNVYSNGQLGGDREIAESIQNGDIAFVVQNTAPQVNFIPELAVFDLPNVFTDAEVARKVLDGPFFEEIAEKYDDSGFKLLGYADQGFRTMSSNKEITKIDDFKGQKIRTMENPNHLDYWKALGSNPTPMAFAEVYIGLQQGTIDAQENPYEVIVSAKLYEQQDYVINTNHLLHLLSLIASPDVFNGLSEEEQQIVMESADEAKVWARQEADNRVADRVKIITDSGTEIVDLDESLKGEMAERAESVYTRIRKDIGDGLVDSLMNAVKEQK